MSFGRRRDHFDVPPEPKNTCPDLDEWKKDLLKLSADAQDVADRAEALSYSVEDLREANSNLRKWGEDSIKEANSKIDDLGNEVANLKDQLKALS